MHPYKALTERFQRIDFSRKPTPYNVVEKPLILNREVERYSGEDFRVNNIVVVEVLGELVEATYGPKGLEKMILGGDGVVWVTSDCQTILEKLEFDYPTAKSIASLVTALGREVGDGRKTAVLLTASFLSESRKLIEQGFSPHEVIEGYEWAATRAIQHYRHLAIDLNIADKLELTRLTSNMFLGEAGKLGELCVEAALKLREKLGYNFDLNAVRFTKMEGGTLEESRLVEGFVIRRELADESMPRRVSNASIMVLKGEIRDKKRGYTDYEHTISVEDPAEIEAVRESRVKRFRETVTRIKETGANVVILEQGIDPLAAKMLSDVSIMVVRRFTIEDLERIAQATGAQIIYDVNDLSNKALGYARLVEIRKHHGHEWMFIEGCRNPRSLTLLLKGLSERSLNEWERKLRCALTALKVAFQNPRVVLGGGAADLEVSRMLHEEAGDLNPRRRIIAQRFANSLLYPIEALIKNAGLDPLSILPTMKAKHRGGEKHVGFNALEGKIADMSTLKIYDSLAVKESAISSAVEAASVILRIDDYVKAKTLEGKAKAEKLIEDSRSREYKKKLYREHRLETAEP